MADDESDLSLKTVRDYGESMRQMLPLFLLLVTALGSATDKDPSHYPLTAHVLSKGSDSSNFIMVENDNGVQALHASVVKFRIGKLVYTTGDLYCMRHVQVGSDVHARVDGRWLRLLTDDGHTCSAIIDATREIPKTE